MSPTLGLMAVNFFLADVAGGLGPTLASWLAQVAHWSAERIGYVTTASAVIVVIASTPTGALADRLCRTQTAIGAVTTAQAIGAAISATFGGVLATRFGWTFAFGGLAIPPVIAFFLLPRLLNQPSTSTKPSLGSFGSAKPKAAASSARV